MYKYLFWGLVIVLLLTGIAGGAYWYGQQQALKMMKVQANLPTPTVSEMQKKDEVGTAGSSMKNQIMQSEDKDFVPVGANTVSYARKGDKVILRYRGKIYDDTNQAVMDPVKGLNEADYKWYGLVDASNTVPAGEFMNDEVFGLMTAPNKNDFVFIMRWAGNDPADKTNIFYYIYTYNQGVLNFIYSNKNNPNNFDHNYVPKIDAYNSDSTAISFNMYPCWNCGGGAPSKGLMDVKTAAFKDIGRTSYFKWTTGKKYEYKDYIKIDCTEPGPGECSENPEKLPLKTGSFE